MVDTSRKLDVIVVGGSLAGLFSSIALLRQGHNVIVLERSPTPLLHHQGAGVVAGGETQAFFSRYDLTRRPIAVTSTQRLYLDKQGHVVDREDTVQRMTSWDLLYYLGRANFDRVKSDYLSNGEPPERDSTEGTARYEYGRIVTDAMEVGDKVEVVLEDVRPGPGNQHAPVVNDEKQASEEVCKQIYWLPQMVLRLLYVVSSYHLRLIELMQDT